MAKILVVEDDRAVSESICNWMTFERHVVESSYDGKHAVEMLRSFPFDLVILDWDLPGLSGIEVLKQFRQYKGSSPVLMLTGKAEMKNKHQGFESGVDDYLTKPFDAQELLYRVRALLRRGSVLPSSTIQIADISLDTATCKVMRAGKEIHLTAKELALLEFLMKNPDQVFNTGVLLNKLWASDAESSTETVRVLLSRLRSKIDQPGQAELIQNVRGLGYKFQRPENNQ